MSSNLDTNLDILKIVGVLIVLAGLGVGGYFLWKKYHNIKPSCGPNQDYISACNICVDKCPDGSAYDCSKKLCVCSNAQLVLNNGVCVCPDTLQPPVDGQCGGISCPSGQYSCSWDPQNCITPDGESCSFAGAVDPVSGKLIDGSLVPVPCGPDKICLKVGSSEFEKYVQYNPSFKQTICLNNVCSCQGDNCIFQCNGQNFSGYNLKNDRCSAPIELPNCAEPTLDIDGIAVCKKCALYNDEVNDPNYDSLFQKFVPISEKMGCKFNPSPWAWADLTGVACHCNTCNNSVDNWSCNPDPNLNVVNYRFNDFTGKYNACGITYDSLKNASENKKILTSMYFPSITYDFSKANMNTIAPATIVGPYTSFDYNSGSHNNQTDILGPQSWGAQNNTYDIPDDPRTGLASLSPYYSKILEKQFNSCEATDGGHSTQEVWMRNGSLTDSENPLVYQYIGQQL